MELKNKKITKATFKNFIKKAEEFFINVRTEFDGMTDGVESRNKGFQLASGEFKDSGSGSLGFDGIWLVGSSRDRFSYYESETMEGIRVYNSCGSFIVAIKKEASSIPMSTKKLTLTNIKNSILDLPNSQTARHTINSAVSAGYVRKVSDTKAEWISEEKKKQVSEATHELRKFDRDHRYKTEYLFRGSYQECKNFLGAKFDPKVNLALSNGAYDIIDLKKEEERQVERLAPELLAKLKQCTKQLSDLAEQKGVRVATFDYDNLIRKAENLN